jgi:beta-lactamase superfamily II metal-dependent hydrolase
MDANQIGYEIDFLPVGEGSRSGDAITLRWGKLHSVPPQQTVVVIDAGFAANGDQVVNHVKKYYKTDTVDLVVSTHPHVDHIGGLETVIKELKVRQLAMHCPWLTTHTSGISDLFVNGRVSDKSVRDSLKEGIDDAFTLAQLAKTKGISLVEPFAGLSMDVSSGKFQILGPSEAYYESLIPQFRVTPAPIDKTRDRSYSTNEEFARQSESLTVETLDDGGQTTAENDSGAICALTIGGETLLFTGDAGMPALNAAAEQMTSAGIVPSTVSFIQVPHHGSVHNIGPKLLNRLVGPKLSAPQKIKTAIVSVAARTEDIKHPSKRVTNAFKRRGAEVYPTGGIAILHSKNAPQREGWGPVQAVPFHNIVEIYK